MGGSKYCGWKMNHSRSPTTHHYHVESNNELLLSIAGVPRVANDSAGVGCYAAS